MFREKQMKAYPTVDCEAVKFRTLLIMIQKVTNIFGFETNSAR